MNNTMPKAKESTKPVLVDLKKLQRAQCLIKGNPTSWPWKLCMHMAKQAYGIECDSPMPEVGDRNGNFICTHVDIEQGEYQFLSERVLINSEVNSCKLARQGVSHA
ncbi:MULTISPECIES: hypothetical protein [Serratia]|uniref:hypothetical protein n=1 Tax=Serratia TaxID=613 RepID=UPI000744F4A4|nr:MULTISPECIES: hypothetical protein [Serratia]REF42114.1 hypothetical protein C7332_0279 [Serratia ficaria]CAI1047021.1 Uncharacterised protein [Serratia ficaria]CAI1104228.1 Uncharacterised protein [Serratia ficaria]CAI1174016.1 Uncharacterised protein [Serratia ficaria]CAI1199079.1 Uncharacterised protein [Serratia ficaria]